MKILAIIAFVLVLYWRTFKYTIVVDDIRRYHECKKGFGEFRWWSPKQAATYIYNRFYGAATFGTNTVVDHIVTTALHMIICILIYIAFGTNWVSFVASMLYACNPINNQTSIWLNGRRYAISIILMLLIITFKPWGIILYPLMLLFQVTGIFVPVAYMNISWMFIFLIPLLIFLNKKRYINNVSYRFKCILDKDHREFSIKRLYVIVKCYGFYFFKMLIPRRVLMNYQTLVAWGLTPKGNKDAYSFNLDFWKGMLALSISGLGLCYLKGDLFYLWLFMCCAIMQWSGIIGAYQILADRYISLANVMMMYFVAYFANMFLGFYDIALFALMIGYYIAELDVVMNMYRSVDDFFSHQLYFAPKMARMVSIRANFYIKTNRISKAWALIEDGLRKTPTDFDLLYDAAQCSRLTGNYDRTELFLKDAEKNFYLGQEELLTKKVKMFRDQLVKDRENLEKLQKEYMDSLETNEQS